MDNIQKKPFKILVWITLFILIGISILVVYFNGTELPKGIFINTKDQPTIGYPKAKVQVVIFEEPKCSNCKEFNEKIFPKLQEEFIFTNKIRYTTIPVSFLPGSMPAAISLLCVYYQNEEYPNSDLYFTYLDYLYAHQPEESINWTTTKKLLELAHSASPAIAIPNLKKCIETEKYYLKIVKNTEYGKKIMGGQISTPTIYVNGIPVSNITYDEIQKLITDVLKKN